MTAPPGDVAYQPRTAERLIEILRAQAGYGNERSWQMEAAAKIAELTAERDKARFHVQRFVERAEYGDSYGVQGSDFMCCMLCSGGGAPGVSLIHDDGCPCKGPDVLVETWAKEHREELAEYEATALAAESALAKAREVVELYFAPWGAAKGARWEALSGDKPFNTDEALELVQRILMEKPDAT